MNEKIVSVILHASEALVVLGFSVGMAHFFPEHRDEVFVAAFGLLSALAKGARISDFVPLPDYINPSK